MKAHSGNYRLFFDRHYIFWLCQVLKIPGSSVWGIWADTVWQLRMTMWEDVRDHEVWTNVAWSWYSKAADKRPTIGRLYYHIAIMACLNILLQLLCYSKSLSLTLGQTFPSCSESIHPLTVWAYDKLITNLVDYLRNAPRNLVYGESFSESPTTGNSRAGEEWGIPKGYSGVLRCPLGWGKGSFSVSYRCHGEAWRFTG